MSKKTMRKKHICNSNNRAPDPHPRHFHLNSAPRKYSGTQKNPVATENKSQQQIHKKPVLQQLSSQEIEVFSLGLNLIPTAPASMHQPIQKSVTSLIQTR